MKALIHLRDCIIIITAEMSELMNQGLVIPEGIVTVYEDKRIPVTGQSHCVAPIGTLHAVLPCLDIIQMVIPHIAEYFPQFWHHLVHAVPYRIKNLLCCAVLQQVQAVVGSIVHRL